MSGFELSYSHWHRMINKSVDIGMYFRILIEEKGPLGLSGPFSDRAILRVA
jgi:hypothetical protein